MSAPVYVIAEHADGAVLPATYEAVAAAREVADRTDAAVRIVVVGGDTSAVANELAAATGHGVTALESPVLDPCTGEAWIKALTAFFDGTDWAHIVCGHTSRGQNFAPGLAAGLQAGCITAVERVAKGGELAFERPLFGGKLVATVKPEGKAVVTVQPGSFRAIGKGTSAPGTIKAGQATTTSMRTRHVEFKAAAAVDAGLGDAEIVVSAGRGIGSEDGLEPVRRLAARLPKSAVAGSRPVIDNGWLPYARQVGVTGATVAPKLYIACGISGASQHITGMRGAGFVVAINTDPHAAIFQHADIIVVDDLFSFLPALTREISGPGEPDPES